MDLLDLEGIRPAPPPFNPSSEQKAVLDHLYRCHEKRFGPDQVTVKSWRIVIFLACCLAASSGLVIFADQVPAFYSTLLSGFFTGSLVTATRYRLAFQRQWPLLEAIIDWKLTDRMWREAGMLDDHDV